MISQVQDSSSKATVLFDDAALSFELPPGATFADLAEMLADAEGDQANARYITITCPAQRRSQTPRRSVQRRLAA